MASLTNFPHSTLVTMGTSSFTSVIFSLARKCGSFAPLFLQLLNGFLMQTANSGRSHQSTTFRAPVALVHLPQRPGNVVSLTKPSVS